MLSKELINGIFTDEIEAIYIYDKLVGFNYDNTADEIMITDGDFDGLMSIDKHRKIIQFNLLNESIKEYERVVNEFVNYFIGYLNYSIVLDTFEILQARYEVHQEIMSAIHSISKEEYENQAGIKIERNLR